MQIPKDKIIEQIILRGDSEQAHAASAELPDSVDPERDGELLQKFGVDLPAIGLDAQKEKDET